MHLSAGRFVFCFFFFKQKTAYEMRISDWSSDVCSSDLVVLRGDAHLGDQRQMVGGLQGRAVIEHARVGDLPLRREIDPVQAELGPAEIGRATCRERVCQYV